MKSKSNIISGTEMGQDKLLGKTLDWSVLLRCYRMEMKRFRLNLSADQSSVPLRVHPLHRFPLDPRVLRPAVYDSRYWTLWTMRHTHSIIKRYLLREGESQVAIYAIERLITFLLASPDSRLFRKKVASYSQDAPPMFIVARRDCEFDIGPLTL